MTINKAFTPTGLGDAHPANGPLSVERLIRVRDELAAAAKRSDGGNLGYMMADAAKAIDELLERRKAPQLLQPELPEEATPDDIEILASIRPPHGVAYQWDEDQRNAAADAWNACRGAMLQGNHRDLSYPVDPQVAEYEKIMQQALPNSLVAAMELAIEQLDRRALEVRPGYPQHYHTIDGVWDQSNGSIAHESCAVCALWDEMRDYLAAAPQQEAE